MQRSDTTTQPLDALCDDIVVHDHGPMRLRLSRIREALTELADAGGGPQFDSTLQAFADLAYRIESHLSKEEHLLFPAIAAIARVARDRQDLQRSPFVTVLHPIRMLEAEHASIELELDRIRALAPAVAAGPTTTRWQRYLTELADLRSALREHHRAENEMLFPRALDAERQLY